jgi:hypothetical protein
VVLVVDAMFLVECGKVEEVKSVTIANCVGWLKLRGSDSISHLHLA